MKRIILSLFLSLVSLAVYSHETKTVSVEMTRETKDAAIEAALKEAVARVNGVVVREDRSELTQSVDNDGDLSVSRNAQDTGRRVTRGVVKTYDVKSAQPSDKGWTVVVEAEVVRYESPLGLGNKAKIAVMPFRFGVTGFQIGGDGPENMRPSPMVSQEISSMVTKAYTKSGRFNVLSRFGLDEMKQEEDLIKTMAPPSEYVKVGQRLGADYLVVGYIRDLYVASPVTRTSRLSGRSTTMIPKAYLRVTCRRLVVSTAEIAWMEDLDIELDPQTLAGCSNRVDLAYETLIRRLAEKISLMIDANLLSGTDSPIGI